MSHPSIYEANIDRLIKARERFPYVCWTTQAVSWQQAGKFNTYNGYCAAQVSDALSIWMFSCPEMLEMNVRANAPGFYRGWPVEIRGYKIAPPPPKIDWLGITAEICGGERRYL